MQDPKRPFPDEIPNILPKKKKNTKQKSSQLLMPGNGIQGFQRVHETQSTKRGQKVLKRNSKNDVPPLLQQPEISNSDSLPESSTSGDEYRALRRKYLLLEEESFTLGNELRNIETEVKTLEDEKVALLDQLVVLEGLIHPSELQTQGLH